MNQWMKKIIGASCIIAGVGLVAPACGGSSSNNDHGCTASQTYATVNGAAGCYEKCTNGVCTQPGYTCNTGANVCTPPTGTGNNGTGTTNNGTGTTNNGTGTTNNMTTGTTNNMTTGTTNNMTTGMTNNGTCTPLSPSIGPCDPLCQTGCMAMQACVAGSMQGSMTVTAACQPVGTGAEGDMCGQNGGCQAGLGCLSTDGTTSTCMKYCDPNGGSPSCAMGQNCAMLAAGIGVCVTPSDACTQYPNDSCPMGQNCYDTNVGKQCVAYTASAMAGDSCTSPTDCGDAQACVDTGMGGKCYNMCDPANAMCGANETCQALQNVNFGVCVGMM